MIPLVVGFVVLLVVILLLGRALGATNEVRTAPLPAPPFVLKVRRGPAIKLADYKGKVLIVCFFATGDKPSQQQIPILNDLIKEHGETNLAILAIGLEQPGAPPLKDYAEGFELKFPVYPADYDVIQAFGGLTSIPALFVIDKNQNIIQKYVGLTEANILEADLKAIFKQ